jgi:hypothetical protein
MEGARITRRARTVLIGSILMVTALAAALFAMRDAGTAQAGGAAGFNAATDFSATQNPNGAWSYGWSVSQGAAFNLATNPFTLSGLDGWNGGGSETNPAVSHNGTSSDITVGTVTVPAGGLILHPGSGGQNAIVRWTAPSTGDYQITGEFVGLDFEYPTTTDVAVRHGPSELFSDFINSYDVPLPFSITRSVLAGETIDFAVGYGSNASYTGDTTGLDVTISQEPGEEPTPTATTPPTTPPANEGGVTVEISDDNVVVGDDVDVTAAVVDENGDPVVGEDCTFSIVSQPGDDASVDEGPVTTDDAGQAISTLSVGSTAGTVQVQAECGAFTQVLDVVVAPESLPVTGGGTGSASQTWLVALLAAAGAVALAGGLALRVRR